MTASGFWQHENVRAAINGWWLARPQSERSLAGGASIDTRSLEPGQVFFALRGEHTDGHRFLKAAAQAGCGLAVIDDADAAGALPEGLPVIEVPDARAALGRLAVAYRLSLGSVRVVAVTGSNGKTTTTRMIDACLSTTLRGASSRKSFNNDLGVPLTVLGVRASDQYLLCEVGANAPGEIEQLSRMVRPDVAVVTSIGRAHIEGFGSLEAIAVEKTSLAAHLKPEGIVVLSADSPHLRPYRTRFERVVTFGASEDADLRVGDVTQSIEGLGFTINDRERFTIPVLGAHNALNAAAALAVVRRLGVETDAARAGLARFRGPEMRLALQRLGDVTVINDAYNANPESMLAALRTLHEVAPEGGRRVAILGDMLELGDSSEAAHLEIADAIVREGLAHAAALVGHRAAAMAGPLRARGLEVLVASPGGSEAEQAASLVSPGDTVLLKGSRGIRLERVAAALQSRLPAEAAGGAA